jgi:N-formylglutamate amidohydrolase
MDIPNLPPTDAARPPPFTERRPVLRTAPLIFTSPHSGCCYPPDFIAASRLDPRNLRRSEDSFVDELFAAAPGHGAVLLAATFPRAYCDANREAWELDPAMFEDGLPDFVNDKSPRVAAGLGTIPRVVASGEPIYRARLRFGEAKARIEACWEPFHHRLTALVAETRGQFGRCLLIDCHSMPAAGLAGLGAVDVVLGDAHGTAATPTTTARIETLLGDLGLRVRRNDPYAGGFITRHYGRPGEGVQAVQIELARRLYMDEARIERAAGFSATREAIARFIATLAREAADLLR